MQKDFDFFMNDLKSLFDKYAHRFLVLNDAQVIADFGDIVSAYSFGCNKYGLGHFSIYECKSPDYESYVIHYANNNVAFA